MSGEGVLQPTLPVVLRAGGSPDPDGLVLIEGTAA
jgi:hypothetical protein